LNWCQKILINQSACVSGSKAVGGIGDDSSGCNSSRSHTSDRHFSDSIDGDAGVSSFIQKQTDVESAVELSIFTIQHTPCNEQHANI